jgi:hypothetical protein
MQDITFYEFLKKLSVCSGDEAIELISKFQSGALIIGGIGIEDFDDDD